jgi:hypothetical protein
MGQPDAREAQSLGVEAVDVRAGNAVEEHRIHSGELIGVFERKDDVCYRDHARLKGLGVQVRGRRGA